MKPSQIIRRAAERLDGGPQLRGDYSCLIIENMYQPSYHTSPDLEPGELFDEDDCAKAMRLYAEMLYPGLEYPEPPGFEGETVRVLEPHHFTWDPVSGDPFPDNDIKQHRVMAMLLAAEVLESEGL